MPGGTSLAFAVQRARDVTRAVPHARPVVSIAGASVLRVPWQPKLGVVRTAREAWCALVAIAVVNFSDALLLLRVLQLGFSTTQVVLAYVLFNAVYTLLSYPAGVLTDRWPRPVVYAIGLVAFAVGYLGLGLTHGGAPTYVLVAVYGLFPAFTDGVGKAWVASLVPRHQLGRAQGTFQALNSAAVLVAGVWAGLTWRLGSGDGVVPLVIAGSVAAVAAVGLIASSLVQRTG